jgi:hypothetical protein
VPPDPSQFLSRVEPVLVIRVDVVGAEPLQRGDAGPAHVVSPIANDIAAVAVARYQPKL